MITGELKSKIDKLWTTFWNNGISNPLSVIEQISYWDLNKFQAQTKPKLAL
ncbi:MAG: hypothetical protein LW635_08420 [Microcystis sp. 53598_E5]|nr:hypothetical protein [Microcystis sp. 53598_E5]